MEQIKRRRTIYEVIFKRPLDFLLSLIAIIILSPIMLIIALLVRIKLGGPVLFKQARPGKNEKIFNMYKFRSMTNEKDEEGNLLPDEVRLTKFGKFLRSTSLDELPGLFNILTGKMSIVGPRPQLIKDMWFMSTNQRRRHLVRPGLTGLAQVNGRNAIDWENKLQFDLDYIEKITFWKDLKIIFKTAFKVLKRSDINQEGMETAQDYGDYLLSKSVINYKDYNTIILKKGDTNEW